MNDTVRQILFIVEKINNVTIVIVKIFSEIFLIGLPELPLQADYAIRKESEREERLFNIFSGHKCYEWK